MARGSRSAPENLHLSPLLAESDKGCRRLALNPEDTRTSASRERPMSASEEAQERAVVGAGSGIHEAILINKLRCALAPMPTRMPTDAPSKFESPGLQHQRAIDLPDHDCGGERLRWRSQDRIAPKRERWAALRQCLSRVLGRLNV